METFHLPFAPHLEFGISNSKSILTLATSIEPPSAEHEGTCWVSLSLLMACEQMTVLKETGPLVPERQSETLRPTKRLLVIGGGGESSPGSTPI